ncbi:MAG TPA: hypothetical protein DIW81_04540 [Planctomycetaceae bacterium]|uniref:type II toxin-antitoxin system RelE/ParE family toxin n=1 Tax=Rubinisphaera sp. TaxID=2024857 RepID=UPI000C0EB58A|nr:type II toxin-antitoxin system RelE/ParE family toxin [Rubinisphaera sp.]MBV08535.1 hypothetical protein [Rubinisphaera sp.]HCS50850.1 hypothetical protein [Planctomycetaceae bacterium]
MNRQILLTVKARQDILDIWEYIARQRPTSVDKMVDRFNSAFLQLAKTPGIGIRQDH